MNLSKIKSDMIISLLKKNRFGDISRIIKGICFCLFKKLKIINGFIKS